MSHRAMVRLPASEGPGGLPLVDRRARVRSDLSRRPGRERSALADGARPQGRASRPAPCAGRKAAWVQPRAPATLRGQDVAGICQRATVGRHRGSLRGARTPAREGRRGTSPARRDRQALRARRHRADAGWTRKRPHRCPRVPGTGPLASTGTTRDRPPRPRRVGPDDPADPAGGPAPATIAARRWRPEAWTPRGVRHRQATPPARLRASIRRVIGASSRAGTCLAVSDDGAYQPPIPHPRTRPAANAAGSKPARADRDGEPAFGRARHDVRRGARAR